MTMPSGYRWACSMVEIKGVKTFALVPFNEETGSVNKAISWDTQAQAEEWVEKMREHPEGEKFFAQFENWGGKAGWRTTHMGEPDA